MEEGVEEGVEVVIIGHRFAIIFAMGRKTSMRK